MIKKYLCICLMLFLFPYSAQAFVFGLKSTDNSVENIVNIEHTYNLYLPLIGFIYDPRDQQDVIAELNEMKEKLGDERIYHITVSPDKFSAQEVADGAFDEQYIAFFEEVKKLHLKVIFRTMHEMNGGWYPRSSNPETFKKAWIHVRDLSRSLGLNEHNILFDFSVNHRDMPTKGVPSQKAKLIECKQYTNLEKQQKKLEKKKNKTQADKKKIEGNKKEIKKLKSCYRFEDYFPGNEYVDVVGVTFYNRGKATSGRLWKTPSQILNDTSWNTVERLKKLGEPIFIDEVGTTAVYYSSGYSAALSKAVYATTGADERKNLWLKQLGELLKNNHFLGALYFNVDYTHGLDYPSVGEADRSIINLELDKFYQGFWDLYGSSQADFFSLLALFGLNNIEINGHTRSVPWYTIRSLKIIDPVVNKKIEDPKEKSDFYQKLLLQKSGQASFDEAVEILAEEYYYEGNRNNM